MAADPTWTVVLHDPALHPQHDYSARVAGPLVLATPGTKIFRQLARWQCAPGDVVLEIGASYAECSRYLCGARSFLGVDNSYECVQACRKALPSARFERLDALTDRAGLTALLAVERPTLIAVDVGGSRALPDVLELLEFVLRCMAALDREPTAPDSAAAAEQDGAAGSMPARATTATIATASSSSSSSSTSTTSRSITASTSASSSTATATAVGRPLLVLLKSESLVASLEAHLAAPTHAAAISSLELTTGDLASLTLASRTTGPPCGLSSAVACPSGWWATARAHCQAGEGGKRVDKAAGLDVRMRRPNWYPQRSAVPGGTPICRFHNYDLGRGCARGSTACGFDHVHCHFCLAAGHVAHACSAFRATLVEPPAELLSAGSEMPPLSPSQRAPPQPPSSRPPPQASTASRTEHGTGAGRADAVNANNAGVHATATGTLRKPRVQLWLADDPTGTFERNSLWAVNVFPLLGKAEAEAIILCAESHAEEHGWAVQRHRHYPTTDIAIHPEGAPALHAALHPHVEAVVLPTLARQYGFTIGELSMRDLFLVKYEAAAAGAHVQDRLRPHRDGNLLSFSILLSDPSTFDGGGLRFHSLGPRCRACDRACEAAVDAGSARHDLGGSGSSSSGRPTDCMPVSASDRALASRAAADSCTACGGVGRLAIPAVRQGDLTTHCGKLLHEALPVSRGRRYVVVGFVNVDSERVDVEWLRSSTLANTSTIGSWADYEVRCAPWRLHTHMGDPMAHVRMRCMHASHAMPRARIRRHTATTRMP